MQKGIMLLTGIGLILGDFMMANAVETASGTSLKTIYVATKDFPETKAGEVPYKLPKQGKVLSINAANPAYRGKFARAERVFEGAAGIYDVTIVTLTEFDGECTYRLLVNGKVVGSFTNPRVGKEGDFKTHRHTWQKIMFSKGAQLAVESNAASNDLIPEGDGYAWARGRWSQLELNLVSETK